MVEERLARVEQKITGMEEKVTGVHSTVNGIAEQLGAVAKGLTELTVELKHSHQAHSDLKEQLKEVSESKCEKGHVNAIHDVVKEHEGRLRELEIVSAKDQGTRDMVIWIRRAVVSAIAIALLAAASVYLG